MGASTIRPDESRQVTGMVQQRTPATGLRSRFTGESLGRLTLFFLIAATWIILGVLSPYFLTTDNLYNLVRQTAVAGVIAIGETLTIITAGIDLSVGSVVALTGVVTATLMVDSGWPALPAALLAFVIGTSVGLVNGMIVHRGKLPPFIVTLGSMSVARGAALIISKGRNIAGLPREFSGLAQKDWAGIPSLFVVLVVVAIAAWVLLHRAKWGRYIYAVGSNPEAARLSGVHVGSVLVLVYTLSGALSALGGLMLTSRLAMGMPTAGTGYELDAIAASVVGGASLFGAEGSVLGTIVGAFLISTIWNGSTLLNVDPFWQRILVGVLIVSIVYVDQLRKRRRM